MLILLRRIGKGIGEERRRTFVMKKELRKKPVKDTFALFSFRIGVLVLFSESRTERGK